MAAEEDWKMIRGAAGQEPAKTAIPSPKPVCPKRGHGVMKDGDTLEDRRSGHPLRR
jgi:hypothetical protein